MHWQPRFENLKHTPANSMLHLQKPTSIPIRAKMMCCIRSSQKIHQALATPTWGMRQLETDCEHHNWLVASREWPDLMMNPSSYSNCHRPVPTTISKLMLSLLPLVHSVASVTVFCSPQLNMEQPVLRSSVNGRPWASCFHMCRVPHCVA